MEWHCFSHPAFVRLLMEYLQAYLKRALLRKESLHSWFFSFCFHLFPKSVSWMVLINFHCTFLPITQLWVLQTSYSSFSFGSSAPQQNDLQHALLSDFIITCRKIPYFFPDYNQLAPIINALFLAPTAWLTLWHSHILMMTLTDSAHGIGPSSPVVWRFPSHCADGPAVSINRSKL